jgi:hypothetical protein
MTLPQPARRDGAVLGAPTIGLIVEQVLGRAARDEQREPVGQFSRVKMRQKRVVTQVDHVAEMRRQRGERWRADIRPAPHLAAHQPSPLGFGIAARDRGHRYAEVIGQIALRRQPLAALQPSRLHILGDSRRQRQIQGSRLAVEAGPPHCMHTIS